MVRSTRQCPPALCGYPSLSSPHCTPTIFVLLYSLHETCRRASLSNNIIPPFPGRRCCRVKVLIPRFLAHFFSPLSLLALPWFQAAIQSDITRQYAIPPAHLHLHQGNTAGAMSHARSTPPPVQSSVPIDAYTPSSVAFCSVDVLPGQSGWSSHWPNWSFSLASEVWRLPILTAAGASVPAFIYGWRRSTALTQLTPLHRREFL